MSMNGHRKESREPRKESREPREKEREKEEEEHRREPRAHNLTNSGKHDRGAREGFWGPLDLTNRKSNAIWGEAGRGVSYPPFYGATHLSMGATSLSMECGSSHVAYSMIGC